MSCFIAAHKDCLLRYKTLKLLLFKTPAAHLLYRHACLQVLRRLGTKGLLCMLGTLQGINTAAMTALPLMPCQSRGQACFYGPLCGLPFPRSPLGSWLNDLIT